MYLAPVCLYTYGIDDKKINEKKKKKGKRKKKRSRREIVETRPVEFGDFMLGRNV